MKIVADHKIPFLKGAFEDLAEIIYLPGNAISKSDLIDADALIVRTRTKCNEDLLSGTKVKFIATATIGFDHIDVDYCEKNGIEWTNAPGCNSSSVEQYIVSSILSLSSRKKLSLNDMTLGVVGIGNVGKKVVRVAKSLGLRVLLNDPPRQRMEGKQDFVELGEIQHKADIITFHVPLNKEGEDKTFHLADKNFLSGMKKNSILINTSRGEVVDNMAIKEAIKNDLISGVVLDVWEGEPNIDLELLSLVDFATPHIAGYSTDGKANGTMMSVQAVSKHFGMGLDSWTPVSLPLPDNKNLEVNCSGLNEQKIIEQIYIQSYNIENDDHRLRNSPQEFENHRGNYPVRRESSSYSVKLLNNENNNLENTLKTLGFKL